MAITAMWFACIPIPGPEDSEREPAILAGATSEVLPSLRFRFASQSGPSIDLGVPAARLVPRGAGSLPNGPAIRRANQA
jgi:hypothetical protein